jgi:uncharacterized protein YkwD
MPRKPKQQNQHHIKRLHKYRVGWYMVLAVGLIGAHFSLLPATPKPSSGEVLPYATNVTITALADATNQQRAAQGLGALALQSKLNEGAQAKANHMIANNYWAHTAPDGTEPWDFFSRAGYNYQNAGENLAYGFDASAEIVDAWMDSPGHRANVLGNYKDMGFGYASGDSYQGGQYTVVVAFYGTQQATKPAAKATPTPAPVVTAEPAKQETPAPEPVVEAETAQPTPKAEPISTDQEVQQEEPQTVNNLQNIFNGNAGWPMYTSLTFVGISMIGFTATHVQLVRRGWRQTRHFIIVHPALDAAMVVALVATLLTATIGFIR